MYVLVGKWLFGLGGVPLPRTIGFELTLYYSLTAQSLSMGPLLVAMPRTNYRGAFSESGEASSSKLVGGDDEDEEMTARQMASRLSTRLGIPVFVSCSFDGAPQMAREGVDRATVQHRAAAQAEREIARILQEKIQA